MVDEPGQGGEISPQRLNATFMHISTNPTLSHLEVKMNSSVSPPVYDSQTLKSTDKEVASQSVPIPPSQSIFYSVHGPGPLQPNQPSKLSSMTGFNFPTPTPPQLFPFPLRNYSLFPEIVDTTKPFEVQPRPIKFDEFSNANADVMIGDCSPLQKAKSGQTLIQADTEQTNSLQSDSLVSNSTSPNLDGVRGSGIAHVAMNVQINEKDTQQHVPKAIGSSDTDVQNPESCNEGNGMFSWVQKTVQQSDFLSKVADKAKVGMDSILIALDPGMKGYLNQDGNVFKILIECDTHRISMAIGNGFRRIFYDLDYQVLATPKLERFQPQAIGYRDAMKLIDERASMLIADPQVPDGSVIVQFQPFLHQIEEEWYESSIIALRLRELKIHVYSQPVAVNRKAMTLFQSFSTSSSEVSSYPRCIGSCYAQIFGTDPDDWQQSIYSFSSSELYAMASATLASLLKNSLSKTFL